MVARVKKHERCEVLGLDTLRVKKLFKTTGGVGREQS